MKIEERVFERAETVGVDNLTEAEKTYWLIWLVEAEANNGGLEQFLNSCSVLAEEAAIALDRVGAKKMSVLLHEAIAAFKAHGAEKNELLRTISNNFTDYPDDLAILIDTYVKNNASSFLGPNTELELWEQRKARGAETTPKVVTRVIDFDEEAKLDEKYSSRNCVECNQPVPDYRKNCKKCGYPIGRK